MNTSCVSHKSITSLKDGKHDHMMYTLDSVQIYKLVPGDKLLVQVTSNGEKLDVFDKQLSMTQGNEGAKQLQGYDVDSRGDLELPVVGKVHVSGLTVEQCDTLIENRLKEYYTSAYVKTSLLSFRITIIGEVRAPQTFVIDQVDMNILQAIGRAGDFTEYSDRSKVKVYRKRDGAYEMYLLDLGNDKVFMSPVFQLQPNDVIYVQPSKVKVVRTNITTITVVITVISFVLVLSNYIK